MGLMTHDSFGVARRRMVEKHLVSRGIKDERVLDVMGRIPRHIFVEEALQDQAYSDYPLGIGEGQTISQPFIVGLMTETLKLKGDERVLEIGTGCGYQTAVLCLLARQVFSIERIRSLSHLARNNLKRLECFNAHLKVSDGSVGWTEKAPFDAIISAAGSPDIPRPLVDQLAMGGRLVLPVGSEDEQRLIKITRTEKGAKSEDLGPCRFVKLVGHHGWRNVKREGGGVVKRSIVPF
jgi:protein-L-isoaspartate(D-aspartate) O-methyltransferase